MSGEDFVDATTFLGMHSVDEADRLACVSFFAARMDTGLAMTLDEVGRCDDVIWGYTRAEQDAYYPFMDNLHTDARLVRLGYRTADVARSMDDGALAGLPVADRLLLAVVLNRSGTLHTLNPALLARADLPVRRPSISTANFPSTLDELYRTSLRLLVGAS